MNTEITHSLIKTSAFSQRSTILALGLHSTNTSCNASAFIRIIKIGNRYHPSLHQKNYSHIKHDQENLTVNDFCSSFVFCDYFRISEIQLLLLSFFVRHCFRATKRTCITTIIERFQNEDKRKKKREKEIFNEFVQKLKIEKLPIENLRSSKQYRTRV